MESIGKEMYALRIPGTLVFQKGEIVTYYDGESSEDMESCYPRFTGTYVQGVVHGEFKDVTQGNCLKLMFLHLMEHAYALLVHLSIINLKHKQMLCIV